MNMEVRDDAHGGILIKNDLQFQLNLWMVTYHGLCNL
jgi:hypothetical protein